MINFSDVCGVFAKISDGQLLKLRINSKGYQA